VRRNFGFNARKSPSLLLSKTNSENTFGFSHGGFDVKGPDVLPVLLEEGDQKVDCKGEVLKKLVLGHFDMSDGNSQTQHFFQLEFDGAANLLCLGCQGIRVGDQGGELSGFVQSGSQNTRNLLDKAFGSKEGIKLLGCRKKSRHVS